MRRTARTWHALVTAGTLETLRRKDLYVVVVLTALMVAGAGAFALSGIRGLDVFLRDVGFTGVGVFSTILTVLVASRQIPEEVQRKTIYPLLARPITRWQLLVGKWLAACLASVGGFLILAAVTALLLTAFGAAIGPIFWQYLPLKALGLVWLCAVCVALSVYTTQGACVTLALILAFGSAAFTRATLLVHAQSGGAWVKPLYGLLPHYDFFDLGAKVTYGWPPVGAWVILSLAAYAFVGSLLWLGAGWLRFRRAVV